MVEQAHLLWERLADFDAADVDAALDLVLRVLCRVADARTARWIGAAADDGVARPGRLRDPGERRELEVGLALYVGLPVNDEAASWFGLFREAGQRPFGIREREAVAGVLRGTRRFNRHLLLSHGLLLAESPLTPAERRVLKHLLGGLSEKQIAAEVEQSFHTTHEYVRYIYRKFGVKNRATLMALWLGKGA